MGVDPGTPNTVGHWALSRAISRALRGVVVLLMVKTEGHPLLLHLKQFQERYHLHHQLRERRPRRSRVWAAKVIALCLALAIMRDL